MEAEMAGTCSMHWGIRNEYEVLVGKPEMKRPFGRRRHRRDILESIL
jgi:hypothetical protein